MHTRNNLTRAGFLQVIGGAALAAAAPISATKGKWFPSEMRKYADTETGREVWQITNSPYPSSNLYFTAQSFTKHNRGLVFLSTRTTKTELYMADLETGRFRQLTESEMGVYGACVCPKADSVAYADNGAIWMLDLQTLEQRKIFTIPKDQHPDLLSIDDSGAYVAFAYCKPLPAPLGPDRTHHSTVVRVRTDGTGFDKVHEEDYWISHVLINPTDPDTILFCHEGSWDVVAQRLWVVQADGSSMRKLRPEEEPAVQIGHEFWTSFGREVGYHGSYKNHRFIGRVNKDGTNVREYTMAAPAGHTSGTEDGRLVLGDGTVEYPYISLYQFKGRVAIAEPICNSGRVRVNGMHAHANFSTDGRYIVFGGERDGQANVYVIKTNA